LLISGAALGATLASVDITDKTGSGDLGETA